jgi:hypothetical protein
MKNEINFNDDIDVRDNLMSLQTNIERKKLLYKWVRGRLISFEQFNMLIYYCK